MTRNHRADAVLSETDKTAESVCPHSWLEVRPWQRIFPAMAPGRGSSPLAEVQTASRRQAQRQNPRTTPARGQLRLARTG